MKARRPSERAQLRQRPRSIQCLRPPADAPMSDDLLAILVCLLGYLLGPIPFGLLLTKVSGLGDIRGIGSGNIGATNVLRTGRKGLAAATLVLDGLKRAAAVLIGRELLYDQETALLAGLAAVLGHLFPIWLRFK